MKHFSSYGTLGVALLAIAVSAVPAASQTLPATSAVPAAVRIDERLLNQAVRASLACAASNLLAKSATNYMNLVVEPYLTKKIGNRSRHLSFSFPPAACGIA